MTAAAPTREEVSPVASTEPLGVWLVSSASTSPDDLWEQRLTEAAKLLGMGLPLLGRLKTETGSLAAIKRGAGDVLLVIAPLIPGQEWLAEVRASQKGTVLVGPLSPADRQTWSTQVPVVFLAADQSAEALGLALLSASAAARREITLQTECEQLEQRLQDRILLERAKGILVQRQSINEEEAYRRLRAAARRQRRALRDVARAIIDTDQLLDLDNPSPTTIVEELEQ